MRPSDEKTRARLDYLEWEARSHPRRHAMRLVGLALLGYLYPLVLLTGSFGLALLLLALAPAVWDSFSAEGVLLYLVGLVGALALATAILRTFWVKLPLPEGQTLAAQDALPLRSLIEDVRQASGGTPIHHIHIDVRLNAAVAQRPRLGLWGPRVNHLVIGLPMLMAITPEQLRAILAHELGHLHGRHSTLGAWIYRIHQTWESLAAPFASAGRLRWLVMGWFVRWYGAYFATSTVALRRLNEYAADRSSAALASPLSTARSLVAIALADYRLDRGFWPTVFREAGHDRLPPADIFGRMAEFLGSPPTPEVLRRWQTRERCSRTPVTADHPCLADRLEALDCRRLLESDTTDGLGDVLNARPDSDRSALALLADCRDRIWTVANASWKALAITRWRMEHANAEQMLDKSGAIPDASPGSDDPERCWQPLQFDARFAPPDQAAALLHDFVARFPGHATASFVLGRLLLEQDDETAVGHLENAMGGDSGYIAPALHLLLDYYRETGRDLEADPIQRRLAEYEQALARARKERLKVSRRERFLPHDLPADQVEKVARILYRYPQIRSAYLVRKQVRLFTDKPGYVLAITRRSSVGEDTGRADKFLIDCIQAQVPLPCAVVILGWRSALLQSRLQEACPSPVFLATD